MQMAFVQGGYEHQMCFDHPWTRWATLYSVAKIVHSTKVAPNESRSDPFARTARGPLPVDMQPVRLRADGSRGVRNDQQPLACRSAPVVHWPTSEWIALLVADLATREYEYWGDKIDIARRCQRWNVPAQASIHAKVSCEPRRRTTSVSSYKEMLAKGLKSMIVETDIPWLEQAVSAHIQLPPVDFQRPGGEWITLLPPEGATCWPAARC
ncbi:hypothetical protein ACU4GD_12030 [Cupriavidus basilensis]